MTDYSAARPAAIDGRPPTIGVEEEYFLVDPRTRSVVPAGPQVVARATREVGDQVTKEFDLCQVEGRTSPCRTAKELYRDLGQPPRRRDRRRRGVRRCRHRCRGRRR
ncbi:glutamate-cysteine ligase family protein [Streptomyces hydrogenans]|uniref:glutamate-cysteine ligase family protein n=1 Tax=Streptomyces hydrogenans TaxID=1873719 RepID=UPI0037F8D95E